MFITSFASKDFNTDDYFGTHSFKTNGKTLTFSNLTSGVIEMPFRERVSQDAFSISQLSHRAHIHSYVHK